MRDIYYPCNVCLEVFGTYDEQLQHHIEHYELYCFACKKFRGMPLKDDLRHHNECNWSLPQTGAQLRSGISITEQQKEGDDEENKDKNVSSRK